MSGEHAKKITGEKLRSSRKKNEGKTPSKEAKISSDKTRRTRMNPPAPSNHTRRATRRKEDEVGGILQDRLIHALNLRRQVYIFKAPRV